MTQLGSSKGEVVFKGGPAKKGYFFKKNKTLKSLAQEFPEFLACEKRNLVRGFEIFKPKAGKSGQVLYAILLTKEKVVSEPKEFRGKILRCIRFLPC